MDAEQKTNVYISCPTICTLDANDNVYDMCSIKFQIVLVKIVSVTEKIKTIKTKNVRYFNEWTIKFDNEYFYRSFALVNIIYNHSNTV